MSSPRPAAPPPTEPLVACDRPLPGELVHAYGERVHLHDDRVLATALARFCGPDVRHPAIEGLLRTLYTGLCLRAMHAELPSVVRESPTRMRDAHPEAGIVRAEVLDPEARVVVVDVVRGGIVPAQTCFELLAAVLPDERLRLDHLTLSRVTGPDGHVRGVDLSGSKIGGPVEDAILVIPDPMGATGRTLVRVCAHYREHHGRPRKIVALPLVATPEFLRAALAEVPELAVHALRLDRGLSRPDVLATPPGTHWDRERGLDEHDYIVPGAGGVGEVLNNSWC